MIGRRRRLARMLGIRSHRPTRLFSLIAPATLAIACSGGWETPPPGSPSGTSSSAGSSSGGGGSDAGPALPTGLSAKITSTRFLTADHMLASAEMQISGEPFAELLGRDLGGYDRF